MAKPRIDLIVMHCAATPNGKAYGNAQRNVAEVIDNWHRLAGFKRRKSNVRAYNHV